MGESKITKSYDATYSSYSGCDIIASITIPGFSSSPLVVGELQTISYSIHREVSPVRTLGRANPKGFTAGTRTIAGSLIFTVFDSNLVHRIVAAIKSGYTSGMSGDNIDKKVFMAKFSDRIKDIDDFSVMDEMPPFDVTISFMNEYGNQSTLVIKGIVIVDEGQVMSIEDMITENTMSYMASDIQVLKKISSTSTTKPPVSISKSDTALSSLSVSPWTLVPKFDPAVTSYTIILPEGSTVVPAVTAIPRNKKSAYVVLTASALPGVTQVVVSGEDKTVTRYKVSFKMASADATLSALKVDGIAIPEFEPDTFSYVYRLWYGSKAIPNVEPTPASNKATVRIDRTYSLPGTTNVIVTSQDGKVQSTYSVSFEIKDASTESRLASLAVSGATLSPAFSSDRFTYSAKVTANGVPSISAKAKDNSATIGITQVNAVPGTASVLVVAQDGITQSIYTINITK